MTNPAVRNRTLEETPKRVLMFLRAVGTFEPIRMAMFQHGYTRQDHEMAWSLLQRIAGYADEGSTEVDSEAARIRRAMEELDAWDEPAFRRIHAALQRLHPEQDAFVFQNLEAQSGPAAVTSVAMLLDRLDALEDSPLRKSTRKEDQAALATLARRGFTAKERKRLRALVKIAQSVPTKDVAFTQPEAVPSPSELERDMEALRSWWLDWSETARAAIKRRDYLMRLGLVRRSKKTTPVVPPVLENGPISVQPTGPLA